MAAGTVWHLQAHFVYKNNGFVEKYFLIPGDGRGSAPIDPIAVSQDLLKRRVLWLGTGGVLTATPEGDPLTWATGPVLDLATVSLTDNPKDGYLVDMNGFQAAPINMPYDPINDRCSGPEFRFETPGNQSANRILRGCPDSWEQDSLPQPPMPLAPAGGVDINGNLTFAAPLPAIGYSGFAFTQGLFRFGLDVPSLAPAQLKLLRASFLDAVCWYCGVIYKGNPVNPDPSTWTMPTNNYFCRPVFRQMSDHRSGKRSDITRARAKKRV